MERRDKERFSRRLEVRFHKKGEDDQHIGFTANISITGMFVATTFSYPRGTRIVAEVVRGKHSFLTEGVVMHAARVSPALQKVRPSGMGIRFLPIADLVAELVPSAAVIETEAPPVSTPVEPAVPPTAAPSGPAQAQETAEGRFTVKFESLPAFLHIFESDVRNGGIFVRTNRPAPLQDTVLVEMLIPEPIAKAVRVWAKVIHRVEAHEGEENLLAGMGLQFSDTTTVVELVTELVYQRPG